MIYFIYNNNILYNSTYNWNNKWVNNMWVIQ